MITRKVLLQRSLLPFTICQRCFNSVSKPPRVPEPTPFVPNTETLLSLIGRDLTKHASKFPSWQSLFTMSSEQMKEAGIEPPRTRRYLLRWLEKFRRGDYGIGGDLQHVKDGAAEVRVVEVPALKKDPSKQSNYEPTSLTLTPGHIKLVVNLPEGQEKPTGDTTKLKKVKGLKLVRGSTISGPYVKPKAGGKGSVGVICVQEGMWEERRGRKIDGGERRRAEVRWRRAVEEHRKNN